MKHELGGKIMKKLVRLRAKTYSQLQDNNNGYKKPKGTKKCVIKRKKLNFGIMKTVQKQLKLEKNKIDVGSLKEGQKKFITNNKLILKHNKYLKVKSEMFLLKK